ncbi:FxSxx-COOH system tetratricopeptide repeat protein [Dactylosporangium sp. CA-139066]|uniref:FxSxx-COOH system tetratricopeptide repeat protein n=1 Tax=Dactylosporangium sp. CA-139066 TaxID=3239930 RepID=UPI003D9124D9
MEASTGIGPSAPGGRALAAGRVDGVAVTGDGATIDARAQPGNHMTVYLQGAPADPVVPAPRQPGVWPEIWNLEHRNAGFTGRERELATLRERLTAGGPDAVQALCGMGGIGKTQLAAEYAHRNKDAYDIVWSISAEQAGLIGEQYTALGVALGVVDPQADSTIAEHAVKARLRATDRWLLIFDNAEAEEDLTRWLPGGIGHVIITSRSRHWTHLARVLDVDVLTRAESVELLTTHLPLMAAADAARIAEALGDLPLALAQAAGFLAETAMSVDEYLAALHDEAQVVLDEGRPIDYPRSLATVIALSSEKLAALDPAALAMLQVCALLAPEPVHPELIAAIAADLPLLGPLSAVMAKPMARARSERRIGTYCLARVTPDGLVLHRLVQAVLRDQLPPVDAAVLRARIETVLGAAEPGDPRDTANWPAWGRLLPHLLAADPAQTTNPALRLLARDAIVHLLVRGEPRPAHDLAARLVAAWRETLGEDHPDTLLAATELVWTYRDIGRYDRMRPLAEDTLDRKRAVFGEDHPDTLRSASNLAVVVAALGLDREAREMDEDTLVRRRRVLGEDDPDTLTTRSNLAATLNPATRQHAGRA